MEAIFFLSDRADAVGVDAQDECVADPVRLESPAAFRALAEVLGAATDSVAPLRDATCQSFPVWSFGVDLCGRWADLSGDRLHDVAAAWGSHDLSQGLDADPYELSTLLEDVARALRSSPSRHLFVLLEEKAL